MPMIDPLYPYWAKLSTIMKWKQEASDAKYQEVVTRYDEDHRHFHVRQHLLNIFSVSGLEEFSDQDQAFFIATTFWHDAKFYTSPPEMIKLSEEHSAQLAEHDLEELDAPEPFIARVAQKIRESQPHKCDAEADPVGAMFLDCDMATLAGTWEQFNVGSEQIDAEFKAIPCETFYAKRLEYFIDPLLNSPTIYLLEENEARWGKSARANLSHEKADIEKKMSALHGDACAIKPEKRQPQ